MAVVLMGVIDKYIGLSSDTKPDDCKKGSRFYEYDTKAWYITPDGGTTWEALPSGELSQAEVEAFVLSDKDDFDVADADANNERWTPGYITGTEGGSADINTTTSGKLMVAVDPTSSPTEARYGVAHTQPIYADFFTVIADLNCTWGATDSATAKGVGLAISKGTTWDSQNYFLLERQKGTSINRISVNGKLNNLPITASNVNTTDDAIALKIERWDNAWRFYYSAIQYPNFVWVLVGEYEDASVYMSDQMSMYFEAYSKGSADAESVQGDFDNFRYYVGAGGGGQYIAGDYNSAWVSSDADGNVFERLEAIKDDLLTTNAGVLQIKATTIDLHQAADTYTLLTGTTQDVLVESLTFRTPVNISDDVGGITGISIQTDDTTPQVFIASAVGVIANLKAGAQITWPMSSGDGAILVKVGKKIQLTLIGGTADADPTTCDVVARYRAVVSGGTLA